MFRIKICGITNVDDARMVARAGTDAVGLNFYPKSPRYITADAARSIAAVLPKSVVKVGLFVNATSAEVCQDFDALGLDVIQLHGDEPPEFLAGLGGRPVVRAFRLGPRGMQGVIEYIKQCWQLACMPRMALIDSYVVGEYGGTGSTADWSALTHYHVDKKNPPLVLAGGLTPANVGAAIHTVRPAAVDAASGVESSPGRKDPSLVAAFIQAAGHAFRNL